MGFNCGIIGLPNVGKSTLFNALTATASAQAGNFPFCTIEPNIGRVAVPDQRLHKIADLAGSASVVPTQLEFVDIAGLVRGAAQGEGLGNQFLANIREVDAVIHVLRCFDNGDVSHVEGGVDPVRDAETIETELMLADIESLDKQIQNFAKKAKSGDKEMKNQYAFMQEVKAKLDAGEPARTVEVPDDQLMTFKNLHLLSAKPMLYVCNVNEDEAATGNHHTKAVEDMAAQKQAGCVVISAAIEAEISQLEGDEEKQTFLDDIGLDEPGLNKIIRAGYNLLDLQTFFTAGPKESRAWTVRRGAKAPEAAGVIHTDFQRGFIKAETIASDLFIELGGEQKAKEAGKMRLEGKDYVVQDGDVILFRFNV
jgi:GTP-binding protein YchF